MEEAEVGLLGGVPGAEARAVDEARVETMETKKKRENQKKKVRESLLRIREIYMVLMTVPFRGCCCCCPCRQQFTQWSENTRG